MLSREEHGQHCESSASSYETLNEGCAGLHDRLTDAAFRNRQREIAKRPRPNRLQVLVLEIVHANLNVTAAQLLSVLRGLEHMGVIDTVTDSVIEWSDAKDRAHETRISALPSLLSRCRAKARNREIER